MNTHTHDGRALPLGYLVPPISLFVKGYHHWPSYSYLILLSICREHLSKWNGQLREAISLSIDITVTGKRSKKEEQF